MKNNFIEKFQSCIDTQNNVVYVFIDASDFLALVVHLKGFGKKVFIFSSQNNISEELRTSGDGYLDVLKIDNIWGRVLQHRRENNTN